MSFSKTDFCFLTSSGMRSSATLFRIFTALSPSPPLSAQPRVLAKPTKAAVSSAPPIARLYFKVSTTLDSLVVSILGAVDNPVLGSIPALDVMLSAISVNIWLPDPDIISARCAGVAFANRSNCAINSVGDKPSGLYSAGCDAALLKKLFAAIGSRSLLKLRSACLSRSSCFFSVSVVVV